jgi:hypothetical protein
VVLVTRELLRLVEHLDDPALPLAEIARRVGTELEHRGRTRPSYETVRTLIHELRARRSRPSGAELFFLDSIGGITPGLMEELKKPRSERRPRRRK